MADIQSNSLPRRHEIDAVRSIALLLLIFYHVMGAFQPFAYGISFLGPAEPFEAPWFLGQLMNTWRIPVLFLISGITAGYLLANRGVWELVSARLMRLTTPLVFSLLVIAPISPALFQAFHSQGVGYTNNPGHLWFIWNLVVYFVFAYPALLYLKYRPNSLLLRGLKPISPYGWLVVMPVVLVGVTEVLEPHISAEGYALHFMRFWNGFACFVCGMVLVSLGGRFWQGIREVCHIALPMALALCLVREPDLVERALGLETLTPILTKMHNSVHQDGLAAMFAVTLEAVCGMLAFIGYGSIFLCKPSRFFAFLNRGVFAVYIIHMPVQQVVAYFLFQSELNAWVALSIHLVATTAISWLIYAYVLRPARFLHPVFGIVPSKKAEQAAGAAGDAMKPKRELVAKIWRVTVLYALVPTVVVITVIILIVSFVGYHMGAMNQQAERGENPPEVRVETASPVGEGSRAD